MAKTYREIQAERDEASRVYWEERFATARDNEARANLSYDYGSDN